jgi:hypothetical protein
MLVEALVARAFAAGGKNKLEALLRETKAASAGSSGARSATFRTSGDKEEVTDAVLQAVESHHLPTHRLAALIDSLEENGAQHIFLYTLTDAGVSALTAANLRRRLPGAPRSATVEYYAEEPEPHTHFEQRDGDLVVKHIYVAEYWEKNERESRETANKRVYVMDRVRRRAVNLVRIRPTIRAVEVRIDRARPVFDQKLSLELFEQFKNSLANIIDFDAHLQVLPIWRGFPAIIAARDETYMATDEGHDPSVLQRLSNLRGGRKGTDIRDHENFRPDNIRDTLNVWWKLPGTAGAGPDDDEFLHCIMTRVAASNISTERAKVYVGKKADPAELEHALKRIRHYTA